jgi:chromosome segregation ATPase
MLSQEDIKIITEIVATQVALQIDPLRESIETRFNSIEERLGKVEERLGRIGERLDKIEGRIDIIEERLDRIEKDISDLKNRVTKLEGKVSALDNKIDKVKADLIERMHDLEDTLSRAVKNNQKALFGAIETSEKKMLQHINKLDDGFHATIQFAMANRKDIGRIDEHLGLYSESTSNRYISRVAEKYLEKHKSS